MIDTGSSENTEKKGKIEFYCSEARNVLLFTF